MARDDGCIEFYTYQHKSPVPLLRYELKIEEAITGIDAGFITNHTKQEVLLSTYSGKIISLMNKASQ